MNRGVPLLVSNGWDAPLRALKAAHAELEIITVRGADDLRSATEQIAHALLIGREVRQRLISPDDLWLRRAVEAGGSVFAQTIGTLQAKSDEWLDNILEGGRSLLTMPSVAPLADCFSGARAIVLGAGPSLDRLTPHLARLRAGAITIAAGSALLPLQRRGHAPDIACVIEGQDRSEQLAPPVDLSRSVVVLAQHGHPRHRSVSAQQVVRADLAENGWFTQLAGSGPPLASGGNVGAFAVMLAAWLGCHEVVLAGLDFSRADGADHAQGATSPCFGSALGESFQIEGVGGEAVGSSALLISYRTNLEGIVHALKGRTSFINLAGRGAARIAGTTELEEEALPPARLPFRGSAAAEIESALREPVRLSDSQLGTGLQELDQQWAMLARLAETLRADQATASEWRAVFGATLARTPGSWGGVLLRGFVLDPKHEPAQVVGVRLARGRDWLERYRRRLGL